MLWTVGAGASKGYYLILVHVAGMINKRGRRGEEERKKRVRRGEGEGKKRVRRG